MRRGEKGVTGGERVIEGPLVVCWSERVQGAKRYIRVFEGVLTK